MIDGGSSTSGASPPTSSSSARKQRDRREKAGNAPPESTLEAPRTPERQLWMRPRRPVTSRCNPFTTRSPILLTIPANSPGVKAGSLVRAWLPFPQEYRQQRDVKLISASPEPKADRPQCHRGKSGHRRRAAHGLFRAAGHRPARSPSSSSWSLITTPSRIIPSLTRPRCSRCRPIGTAPVWASVRRTSSSRPRSAIRSPRIIGNETNALAKARKIFHWVSANIPVERGGRVLHHPVFCHQRLHRPARRLRRPEHRVHHHVPHRRHPGALAERMGDQARRQLGHARLGRDLHRPVGLAAGRRLLRREEIGRSAHRRLLLRPPGQLPDDREPRLGPGTLSRQSNPCVPSRPTSSAAKWKWTARTSTSTSGTTP